MEMKKYKLREVCDIIPGYAFKSSDFGHGNNFVVKIKDINPPEISFSEIDKVAYTPDSKYQLLKNDYVMAMTGATIGKVGINNLDIKNVYVNQRVCKFITKKGFDKQYLYYVLATETFRQFVFSHVDSSSAQPNIGHPTLYDFEFPFPNEAEQRRIAKVLFSLDDKIALNRLMNAKLEQMAKRLYEHWFVQFDFPFDFSQGNPDAGGTVGERSRTKPYKSNGGKMVWNEELKREIPEGWEVKKLDKVLSIKNGKDHKELHDGNYPVFGTGGIMRYVDEFLYSGESILLPRKGSLDNLMYVNDTFWTIDTMFYTEVLLLNGAKYLFYYIDGSNYLNLESGTGRPSMTASAYYSIDVIVPNENVLLNFNKIMKSFEKKKSELIKENQKLTAMRDKLLPLLMNGQVSVK